MKRKNRRPQTQKTAFLAQKRVEENASLRGEPTTFPASSNPKKTNGHNGHASPDVTVIEPEQIEVLEPEEPEAGEAKSAGLPTKKTLWAKIKSYAWRTTAAYLWISWLMSFFGFRGVEDAIKTRILQQIVSLFSTIGFSPVNDAYLPTIFKIGWMILITAFNPIELFLGFWLYVLFFPLTALGGGAFKLWFFVSQKNSKLKKSVEQAQAASNGKKRSIKGLSGPKGRSKIQVFALSLFSLFAWFLLFGGSSSRLPLILGAFLSGWVFWYAMMRLVRLAKISLEDPNTPYHSLRRVGRFLVRTAENMIKSPFSTRQEIEHAVTGHKFARWACKRIANLLGGALNENKISSLILADYGLSLIFVGASAILFWALVIKAASVTMPLYDCLYSSISYFLPNTQLTGVSDSLPLWVKLGPAATAWVLFVLYIGPVGEIVPDRQKQAVERFGQTYKIFRQHLRHLNRNIQRMRRIKVVKMKK
jgi:hypothetical protein